MHNLWDLGLARTRITDAGLDHLKELRGLTTLFVFETRLSRAGIEDLRRALPSTWVPLDSKEVEQAQMRP